MIMIWFAQLLRPQAVYWYVHGTKPYVAGDAKSYIDRASQAEQLSTS